MDSITQAALGAVVAHACWHRSIGRPALLWGFALGTLPDLDILAYPWLDPVGRLEWHRGVSHSLWATVLGAFALAPLVRRVHRRASPPLEFREAWVGVWLIFASHVLIDVFTVYGTQLLAPFSRHGFGLNNLFIIDPLYTLPLVLGALLAATLRTPRARQRANVIGLALSSLYAGWSFVGQGRAAAVFSAERVRQGHLVTPGRTITSATPLNTVLWRHVAEVEGGFLIGYWSWFDADTTVRFDYLPRAETQLAAVRDSRAFGVVDWFSQGFWAVVRGDEQTGVTVADLRFSEIRTSETAAPETWIWPFAWRFPVEPVHGEDVPLKQVPADFGTRGAGFDPVWQRLKGNRGE